MVYLPMCYLYGRRAVGDTSLPLVQSLREELYDVPYSSIRWDQMRNKCAKARHKAPRPLPGPFAPCPREQDGTREVRQRATGGESCSSFPLLLNWSKS